MNYKNYHPTMIATSRIGSAVLNSLEEVARFIFTDGIAGDIHIVDTKGKVLLTTNGIFIDYAWDDEYKQALFEVIGRKQKRVCNYINSMFGFESSESLLARFALDNSREDLHGCSDDCDEKEVFRNFLD